MHVYIHTYIHTYIYIYMQSESQGLFRKQNQNLTPAHAHEAVHASKSWAPKAWTDQQVYRSDLHREAGRIWWEADHR